MARELLAGRREFPACLVCGVDSYINARSLHWLDRNSRLKTPANSDGVIPGEAAAACWSSDERAAGRLRGTGGRAGVSARRRPQS